MKHLRLLRNIHLGVKNLLLHKLRSVLTMLGVVFGVGSVVAMLAVGEGASKEVRAQIEKLGSNNIIINSVKPSQDEATRHMSMMSLYGLLYDDYDRIVASLPNVRRVVPVKQSHRKEARLGTRYLEVRVVGTTSEWFEVIRRPVLAGRVLLPDDTDAGKNPVVLTEHVARRLLASANTVGQSIRIGSDYFEVVGIVEAADAGDLQTPDQATDVYTPLATAQERFGDIQMWRRAGSMERERVELHQIIVEVENIEDVEPTAAAIESLLKRFHPDGDYHIRVPLTLLRQAEQTKRTFNIVLGSIAGISLLVGGIGIMNIMLASVTERTREIGIRRAIGARRAQIVGQFLVETVVLSMIGGLIGVAMGVTLPLLITYLAGMPTVVTPHSVILSLGISMGVGIVFGMYPAMRAANLDPIVALRHV